MTACTRVRLAGSIDVGLPPARAFALFTPEGERAWAHGWEPEFPAAAAGEGDAEPGVVFVTRHGGRATTWTVTSSEPPRAIAYAQATPGYRAGLVSIRCHAAAAGTRVTVGYDLTALAPGANPDLERFAAGYPQFLAHWERAIAAVVG
jgi:Polyketide cyclase / dehydrase and lipid transport